MFADVFITPGTDGEAKASREFTFPSEVTTPRLQTNKKFTELTVEESGLHLHFHLPVRNPALSLC